MDRALGAVVLALTVAAMAVVAALAAVDAVRSLLRYRRVRVDDRETGPAGRARLRGRCFEIPLNGVGGRRALSLWFDPDGGGPGCPAFSYDGGAVKVVERTSAGTLLYLCRDSVPIAHLAYVYVVDPSTRTPALLRVPPGVRRVREAIAWTFRMDEQDWDPVMET